VRVKTKNTMHKPFAYFGTPYVASDTLAYLLEHGYRPSVVITSPDAPRGRGLVLTPCETKALALQNNIPVLTPEKITDEVVAEIAAYGCEYGIVVAYGKILPESLIQAFPLGLINVHYSLLPKYRGASPVEAALRNGDTVTGVAIQQLVRELDAGDILRSVEVSIEPTETTRELRPRLVAIGAELLVSLLPSFEDGTATRTPQDHAQATRCGKILKSEGELNLEDNTQKNWNTYRALAESPGTYFFADRHGKRVRVKIVTATYNGTTFTPDRVIPEGKQEMSYQDFLR
jgi:methionyl-tRNA formyltransferase